VNDGVETFGKDLRGVKMLGFKPKGGETSEKVRN